MTERKPTEAGRKREAALRAATGAVDGQAVTEQLKARQRRLREQRARARGAVRP